MVRHRVGQRQTDEAPERQPVRQRLLEPRVRQPVPLLQEQAAQQHQRPVRRPPDRRRIDLAEQPLEPRPIHQRCEPLQLPVAPRPAFDQPVRQAQLPQLPPHPTPPATRCLPHRITNQGLCKGLKTDEVVLEATGNAMAVVRVLGPYVARVIIANPLQVKAIAHAHVKTDKIDAGVLASLHAAGFLPEVWLPDAETERRRRLVARRNQVVRHRTRVKNETHAILAAHLIPPCPHAELFNGPGRTCCPTTSAPRSHGTCASSTGLAKIWQRWTATSARRSWTSRRCGVCLRAPA